jgi:hypothetical protein
MGRERRLAGRGASIRKSSASFDPEDLVFAGSDSSSSLMGSHRRFSMTEGIGETGEFFSSTGIGLVRSSPIDGEILVAQKNRRIKNQCGQPLGRIRSIGMNSFSRQDANTWHRPFT